MSRSSVAWGAVLLAAGAAGAPAAVEAGSAAPGTAAVAAIPALAFEKVTLPNGLVVILAEDHRAPVVGLDLQVEVGSREDPPGRRGMAALMERVLLHATTRHLGMYSREGMRQAIDAPWWALEAGHNLDDTWLRGRVPAGALELLLWMESDRLGFVADGVDTESVREAVAEADRGARGEGEGIDGHVRAELFARVWGAAHPYGGRSHGAPELDAVTLSVIAKIEGGRIPKIAGRGAACAPAGAPGVAS